MVEIGCLSVCISSDECAEIGCYHKTLHTWSHQDRCGCCKSNEIEGHRMNGIYDSYCVPVRQNERIEFYIGKIEDEEMKIENHKNSIEILERSILDCRREQKKEEGDG